MPSLLRSRPRTKTPPLSKLTSTRFYRLANLVENSSPSVETVARVLRTNSSVARQWVLEYTSKRDRQILLLSRAFENNPSLKEADARLVLGIPAPFFKIIWKYAPLLKRRKEYMEHKRK